jgi:hypothetical protein
MAHSRVLGTRETIRLVTCAWSWGHVRVARCTDNHDRMHRLTSTGLQATQSTHAAHIHATVRRKPQGLDPLPHAYKAPHTPHTATHSYIHVHTALHSLCQQHNCETTFTAASLCFGTVLADISMQQLCQQTPTLLGEASPSNSAGMPPGENELAPGPRLGPKLRGRHSTTDHRVRGRGGGGGGGDYHSTHS